MDLKEERKFDRGEEGDAIQIKRTLSVRKTEPKTEHIACLGTSR